MSVGFYLSISEMSVDSEVHLGKIGLLLKSSEASFCSASEDFQSYNDSAEPITTKEEATQYAEPEV